MPGAGSMSWLAIFLLAHMLSGVGVKTAIGSGYAISFSPLADAGNKPSADILINVI